MQGTAMNKLMTKISIIIPSFNQGRYIGEALESIIRQNYENVEIIIMDGGSNDNTIDVIHKYERYIAYWQSQKDGGQSAAINEGFKKATGTFVTWLNSDDVMMEGTLYVVDSAIKKNPQINWYLGNVVWMDKTGKILKVGKSEGANWFFNKHHLFSNGGPSAFMKKSCLQELGWLREDFHYMMDTELWHRFIENGNPFVRINQYCWGLRLHEDAKMSGHNFKDSPLADKNHPSWAKKKRERTILLDLYPINKFLKRIWLISKLLYPSYYSRFTHKNFLGKHYSTIKRQ